MIRWYCASKPCECHVHAHKVAASFRLQLSRALVPLTYSTKRQCFPNRALRTADSSPAQHSNALTEKHLSFIKVPSAQGCESCTRFEGIRGERQSLSKVEPYHISFPGDCGLLLRQDPVATSIDLSQRCLASKTCHDPSTFTQPSTEFVPQPKCSFFNDVLIVIILTGRTSFTGCHWRSFGFTAIT